MKPNGLGVISAAAIAAAGAGCSMQKPAPVTVLTGRDFVADPATMPTDAAPTPPAGDAALLGAVSPEVARPAGPAPNGHVRVISAADASEGMFDVVARAERPSQSETAAAPSGEPVLIDQKVGEINGRPIRTRDELDKFGKRLAAIAQAKRMTASEWRTVKYPAIPPDSIASQPVTRDDWIRLVQAIISQDLFATLKDELLEAEARASLKPEQKQGLSWLVQEAGNNLTRQDSGSRVAADQRLAEQGKTQEQYLRESESEMLIGYQLEERIKNNVHISWKDVRLYYERHFDEFNPPPTATFRIIRVPVTNEAAVAEIQAALDRGDAFAAVAKSHANQFHSDEGGLMQERVFKGDYATADFGLPSPLQEAARTLKPGEYSKQPLRYKNDRAWVYLDSITDRRRPLSNDDVQLDISRRLTADADDEALKTYIMHLTARASFSDMDEMVRKLTDAAAAQYWPKE